MKHNTTHRVFSSLHTLFLKKSQHQIEIILKTLPFNNVGSVFVLKSYIYNRKIYLLFILRGERIVVGEVRGAEALDMLQAMNTGHDGSLSTGHANSNKDMLSRLETMVLQGAEGLPLAAVRQQIASALDILVHLSRLRDKSRRTMEISEVLGYEGGEILLNPLYKFVEDEKSSLEKVSGSLLRTENPFRNDYKLRLMGYKGTI